MPSRRHTLALAAALAPCAVPCVPAAAAADELRATRSDKLVERSHSVDVQLDRGQATLVVKRTVWNGGPRHDQATFMLELPHEAVATRLRSLGVLNDKLTWFEGELMEAEAAAAKYRELTGIGGYYPKDPALLSWRSQSLLALQVFPVAPSQPKTVEYTLAMPSHYKRGRYHLTLGPMGTERIHAQARLSAANAGDQVFVDDKPAPGGTALVLDKGEHDIAVARAHAEPLVGGVASIPVGRGRVLNRYHFEAAAKMSRVPEGAYVVIVLDASRSIGPVEAAASVAAARAVLPHFTDGHVQVLTFDRAVHARYPGFVPVTTATRDLASTTLTLRNGSNVDDALARADALLSRAPAGAARRIIAMTDLETRGTLTPVHVKSILQSGALLHIGVIRGGTEAKVTRDDNSAWATVARANGGLVWNADASPLASRADMDKVYEEWARPVRLDHPRITVNGVADPAFHQQTLDEGEGIEDLRVDAATVPDVTLEGELWSSPSRTRVVPSEDEAKRWSALVFGSDQLFSFTEPEMMVLATRGHAVSPVTSLLAIEPGVRPSTEGLELSGIGEGGGGHGEGIGLGGIGTIGHGARSFDHEKFLRERIIAALAACGAPTRKVTVSLETTWAEIVDVPSVTLDGNRNGTIERCVGEGTWAIDLPGDFSDHRRSFTITS